MAFDLRRYLPKPVRRLASTARWSVYRFTGVTTIPDAYGVVKRMRFRTAVQKSTAASARNYRARSEIALDVASAYPGGDYFEFGSSGLFTFCSFLGAFDAFSGHTKFFPDTRFYAFDIFGNPDQGSGPPSGEKAFFEAWRNPPDIAAPVDKLETYGALRDRCVLVPGYYQDTLNDAFKARLRAEGRKIGFAFLDVNTQSSYKLVLDFLLDVMGQHKMFIYLDEYFMDAPVPVLYKKFTAEAKKRFNLESYYMRNAGSFGALFCLMPAS